jgi:hypothetical protein
MYEPALRGATIRSYHSAVSCSIRSSIAIVVEHVTPPTDFVTSVRITKNHRPSSCPYPKATTISLLSTGTGVCSSPLHNLPPKPRDGTLCESRTYVRGGCSCTMRPPRMTSTKSIPEQVQSGLKPFKVFETLQTAWRRSPRTTHRPTISCIARRPEGF